MTKSLSHSKAGGDFCFQKPCILRWVDNHKNLQDNSSYKHPSHPTWSEPERQHILNALFLGCATNNRRSYFLFIKMTSTTDAALSLYCLVVLKARTLPRVLLYCRGGEGGTYSVTKTVMGFCWCWQIPSCEDSAAIGVTKMRCLATGAFVRLALLSPRTSCQGWLGLAESVLDQCWFTTVVVWLMSDSWLIWSISVTH